MSANVYPVDAVSGAPSYSGRALRQTLSVLAGGGSGSRPLAGRSGVNPRTPSNTVTATSTTWSVAKHGGYLDLETAAEAGGYCYSFDTVQTGSVTAADATNPRVDIVYVQLSDPAESDGTSTPGVAIGYLAGTPAATPSAPATPARSMVLAQLNVPKSGGGSPSVTWVAPYSVGAGGIIPCSGSSQYPSSPYVGQYIDDASLGLMRWDGSAWEKFGLGGDTGWVNLPIGASWTGTALMRLKRGTVSMKRLVQTTSGNFPTSTDNLIISTGGLPANFRPQEQANFILSGANVGTAVRCTINSDGSVHFVTQSTTSSYVDMAGARYDVD